MVDVVPIKKWPGGLGEMEAGDRIPGAYLGPAETQTVAISAGVLDLSATTSPVVIVTLNQNVTDIQLPVGVPGASRSLRLAVIQDGTGGRTLPTDPADWDGITVEGGGDIPDVLSGAGERTDYSLSNDDELGWVMFLNQGASIPSHISASITGVSGGLVTVTHNLGVVPDTFNVELTCTGAESGFSVGNKIYFPVGMDFAGGSTLYGVQIQEVTTAQYKVRMGTAWQALASNKGSATGITPSLVNWTAKIIASKVAP